MIKIVEAFSGIGSQVKALRNLNIDFEVLNTIEWDINAIYAYDIIHNGDQNSNNFDGLSEKQLKSKLSKYTISSDGKTPIRDVTFKNLKKETVKRVLTAIERSKNLVSIQDVTYDMMPNNIDIFTYSFPCQDLSISGNWHGNEGGIDRNSGNRSSMLWEVERILYEMKSNSKNLPKFLLMENVTSIRSPRHINNFREWKKNLEKLGYTNIVYDLSADNFGVPQTRKRTFMISVLTNFDDSTVGKLKEYWFHNNLENIKRPLKPIKNYLRLDYNDPQIKKEVLVSIPNDTESRRKIKRENPIIIENGEITHTSVRTITTKQDRHPNSGVIEHGLQIAGKSDFRYLTPRECFLMMGFDEDDYEKLIENNFEIRKNGNFFTRDKLIKMAGNSIVVDVMEAIFSQIIEIKDLLEL